ncbi:16S rRNA (guanine(966)-N(2))-methyltransferase [hydrothermal vent metagenome]|uniref:16S rRNA (Guanine(966)-N(2))-methyltransferase n=1 Tax=hydrothermal vent metagenome TaxID=652676 RepID=A0A3B1BU91_9ZZZZ
MRRKNTTTKKTRNQLRIIGGHWRGRKLDFPDTPGLRPTPDRVRETLFNWLTPMIRGSRCLDLFAGSGALGFEALSRGAANVILVDSQALVIAALQKNLALLQAKHATQLQQSDALHALSSLDTKFDLIFLDPPYHQGLLQPCIDAIFQQELLSLSGYLYFETSEDETTPTLPEAWSIHRQKSAGQVNYYLVRHVDQG